MENKKQYPKGNFTGIELAIGIPVGIPIGLSLGNLALGPAIGVPIGLALGAAMEKKYNENPKELTEKEKNKRNRLSWTAILVGTILFIGLLIVYFSQSDI